MTKLFDIWEKPIAKEIYMLVGWRQWADAGSISSGLPEYLIQHTDAKKIGEIKPGGYYLFQIPGTHHFMRPTIKLEDGFSVSMEEKRNEFYYVGNDEKGLIIFLGDEPHMNVDQYCEAMFTAVQEMNVKRIVTVAGVFGPIPYDKERQISCIYSLRSLKEELDNYAVRFSDYEGGSTIGSYMVHMAEYENIEMVGFYGFSPAYDFSDNTAVQPIGVQIEVDYKAWYDILRRCKHMFGLSINLGDLEEKSFALEESITERLTEMEEKDPKLQITEYLSKVNEGFEEKPFDPVNDIWEEGLKDLFDDLDTLDS